MDNTVLVFADMHIDEHQLIICALGQIPTVSASTKRLSWYVNEKESNSRLAEELAKTPYVERWRLSKKACEELRSSVAVNPDPRQYWLQYQ